MANNNEKNTATFIHLSSLTQYFIPFGSYIFPIIIWSSGKDKSEFVDFHGKQVINFQLSMFLYSLALAAIAVPILLFSFFRNVSITALIHGNDFNIEHFGIENITGIATVGIIAILLFIALQLAEFFLIVFAAIKTSNGENYKYPLTINFIK